MAIIRHDSIAPEYVGVCLFPQQKASIMDSYYTDYGVIVYDAQKDDFITVWYACDRSDYMDTMTIDAAPELFTLYKTRQEAAARVRREREELITLMTPAKGKRLEVIKGRKVPLGTIGECFWIGNNGYGTSVGIKDSTGKVHWTAVTNVQVV